MPLETRLLGRTGIVVPRLGLGCATFGREIDEDTSFSIMDYALAQGLTLFDTAEAYGGGQAREYRRKHLGIDEPREVSGEFHSSEKIVGRWLRSRGARNQIVLVSKVTTDFNSSHIRLALDQSLERLGTDFLDVYLFHSFDLKTTLEESLAAMQEARRSRLIRAAGCSNFTLDQLRQAAEVSACMGLDRLEVTETIYNLADREAEKDILPFCKGQDIGFFGYSPLAAGFLTGKYSRSDLEPLHGTRFDVVPAYKDLYFKEEKFRIVEKLQEASEHTGVPCARLAVAWSLSHPDVTSVLVGARSIAHLQSAIEAERLANSEDLGALIRA